LKGGLIHWYSEEGTRWGRSPPRPLFAVPNVTADPSTARVPITVLLYNGPMHYGFNVPIKGLKYAYFAPSVLYVQYVQNNYVIDNRHIIRVHLVVSNCITMQATSEQLQ